MSIRTERMARLVQREVAELLNNEFFEASQSLVTVTGVRVTNDLGIAYVDVSVLGEDPGRRKLTLRRLEEITPEVRSALAGRIRHQVRRIPELKFFLDESQQHVARMEELFDQIREERSDPEEASDERPERDA
jgi:ribosome-binding factor A